MGNIPKTSCLKKIKKVFFLRKKSVVNQRLNKAATLQYTTLNFIKKTELIQGFSVEDLKVLIYSQVNILGGGFFFTEVAGLEFIPAISSKRSIFSYMGPAW